MNRRMDEQKNKQQGEQAANKEEEGIIASGQRADDAIRMAISLF
jgi:hypothetical protein